MVETQEFTLRAMAQNYGDGPHLWDHLDREACEKAADEIAGYRAGIKRLSDEEELCAETTGDDPFSLVYLAAKLAQAEADRDKALAKVAFAQAYGWRHALCAAATTAHGLIAMDHVADADATTKSTGTGGGEWP